MPSTSQTMVSAPTTLSLSIWLKAKRSCRLTLVPFGVLTVWFLSGGGKTWFTAEAAKAMGRYNPATHRVDCILGAGQNRTHMIYVSEDEQRIVTTNVSSGTVSIIAQEPIHMPGPPPGMRRVPQLLPHRPAERARALRAMRRASRDLGSSAGPAREDSREVRRHAARPTGNQIGVPVAISSTNSPKRWACLVCKPTIPWCLYPN